MQGSGAHGSPDLQMPPRTSQPLDPVCVRVQVDPEPGKQQAPEGSASPFTMRTSRDVPGEPNPVGVTGSG